MSTDLINSIDRAIGLMGTPTKYDDYISIKIKPIPSRCCCFHCWQRTWDIINKHIYPCGSIRDESDVLISSKQEKFVLECHESGPEIVFYLGLATVSVVLINSIVVLATTFLKALDKETHNKPARIRITQRRQLKGKLNEEQIIELDLPVPKEIEKKLNDSIKKAFKQKNREP